LVDLGSDDGIEQLQELLDRLNATKTRLGKTSHLDENDLGVSYTATILAPNKIDLPGAPDRLERWHELCPVDFPEHPISAAHGQGLERLRDTIFESLDVIRVYTKLPTAKSPDFEKPFTIPRGHTLQEVAELVHKDFSEHLKFA